MNDLAKFIPERQCPNPSKLGERRLMESPSHKDNAVTTENRQTDRKAALSALWIFLLFNILFADFQWLITTGAIEEILTGTVRGYEMTAGMLLIAAMVHEIPVLMIFLSRILKRVVNCRLNMSMGVLNLYFVVSSGWTTPDQIFFKVAMSISLLLVIWCSWTWPKEVEQ